MDKLNFALGGFVIVVALFKRELLFEPASHRVLLGIAALMFVVGAVLVFGKLAPNSGTGALMNPLFSSKFKVEKKCVQKPGGECQ